MDNCFSTAHLHVDQLSADLTGDARVDFLRRTAAILTPAVVENLPPHFHAIDNVDEAENWFERMVAECHLYAVTLIDNEEIIGFLFVHADTTCEAQLGYLLAEEYWGKGLASELLNGFILYAKDKKRWRKLIGGVAMSHIASSRLLLKLGFVMQVPVDQRGSVVFYAFALRD